MKVAVKNGVRTAGLAITASLLAGCPSQPGLVRADTALDPARYPIACEGGYDQAPRLASGKVPVFPAGMLNNPEKIEDRRIRRLPLSWPVIATFTVTADGQTADIRATQTSPPSFGQHMGIAVRSWRFVPARAGDQAVAARCEAGFTFSL